MKRLLAAVDFSPTSLNALRIAVNLATAFGSDLRMVHVCRDCDDTSLRRADRSLQQQEAQTQMEALVAQYQPEMSGILDFKIQSGKIYKEVVGEAKYSDASLIVTGTHGVSGFEALFIGSNAFRIVTSSESPVLSINHKFKKNSFSRIVLPIDTSRDTRQKVPFTADLARVLQAEVIVLGVYNYADENVKSIVDTYCRQAVEHLQEKGVKTVQEFLDSRRISEVVIDYAKSVDADLISIMSDIDSNAFARMLGGEAQRIVNTSPIPVLCSHADENFNYEISFRGITG